jgi:N-acetylglucosamine kinase-like BadF-type ATPase
LRHALNHAAFRAALLAAAGVANQWDLVGMVYGGKMGRPQIAALCRVVVSQAVAGEPMALEVLHAAAAELADSVEIVLNELGVRGEGVTLMGTGGVIQGSPLYWDLFAGMLRELDPTLQLTVPPVKLAVGAAFTAMAEAGIPITHELRDRVVETQKAFPGARVATAEAGARM